MTNDAISWKRCLNYNACLTSILHTVINNCDLAYEKGPQGGMELLVVQYCREDADFNKKKSSRSDKKCQSYGVSKFAKFCQNFTQFLGYTVLSGWKLWGRKKVFNKKKFFGKNFFGEIFLFFWKYLWGSFLYFTVCTLINSTYTRSNSEGVI